MGTLVADTNVFVCCDTRSFVRLFKIAVMSSRVVYCGCLMKKRWQLVQLRSRFLISSIRHMEPMIRRPVVSDTPLFHYNNYNTKWSKNLDKRPHHRPVTPLVGDWILSILTPFNTWFLGPTEVSSQLASRSVHPFFDSVPMCPNRKLVTPRGGE